MAAAAGIRQGLGNSLYDTVCGKACFGAVAVAREQLVLGTACATCATCLAPPCSADRTAVTNLDCSLPLLRCRDGVAQRSAEVLQQLVGDDFNVLAENTLPVLLPEHARLFQLSLHHRVVLQKK